MFAGPNAGAIPSAAPSLNQKLETITSEEELDGFEGALAERGALSPMMKAACGKRRAEIQKWGKK